MKNSSYTRIGDKYLYTDIVKAGNVYIRIGTQPQISKLLKKHKLNPKYIILVPPVITQAGDNYTGEEFVLWNKYFNNDLNPNIYIGCKKYVKYLYKRLKYTINQLFNNKKIKIIRKNNIRKLFKPVIVKPKSIYKINKTTRVQCMINNILIFHNDKLIYDWRESKPSVNIDKTVSSILKPFKKLKHKNKDELTIIPLGTGNGFNGHTSNFIIQYADRNIWVDVMAEPFLALKKINMPQPPMPVTIPIQN